MSMVPSGAGGMMGRLLDTVWAEVVSGEGSWNPDRSCYDLATEYQLNGRSTEQNVRNFINWQLAKAGGSGFVLGLPGLVFGVVTIPADLATTTYLQLRMVAVIALLHGWDVRSDRVKTIALLSMLGAGGAEVVRKAGVEIGTKVAMNALKNLPGHVLVAINKAVGFRLVTKFGTQGTVNLVKFVPVLGGLVSGGLNAVGTRGIGFAANSYLRCGPGEPEGTGFDSPPPHHGPPDIDGVAEPIGI